MWQFLDLSKQYRYQHELQYFHVRELVVVVSCSVCWVTLHFLAARAPLSRVNLSFTCCSLILLYSSLQNLCNTGSAKRHDACIFEVGLCCQHGRIMWREVHECFLGWFKVAHGREGKRLPMSHHFAWLFHFELNWIELILHDAGYTKGMSNRSAPLLHKETKRQEDKNPHNWVWISGDKGTLRQSRLGKTMGCHQYCQPFCYTPQDSFHHCTRCVSISRSCRSIHIAAWSSSTVWPHMVHRNSQPATAGLLPSK